MEGADEAGQAATGTKLEDGVAVYEAGGVVFQVLGNDPTGVPQEVALGRSAIEAEGPMRKSYPQRVVAD